MSTQFDTTTISLAIFGALVGVSRQRMDTLARSKVVTKRPDGRYYLSDCIRCYCDYLKGRTESDTTLSHRERLTAAQADLAQFELARCTREWVPVADVRQVWTGILTTIKQANLSLPSKVMQRHPDLRPEVFETMSREVREILTDMSSSRFIPGDDTTSPRRGRPRKNTARKS